MQNFLAAFIKGDFVMVYDHEREDEGDLFLQAEHVTPAKINFLQKHARGLICVACEPSILQKLEIYLLTEHNTNPHGTNFCMPVDLAHDVTTGVSAFDKAKTILALADTKSQSTDFVKPGHTSTLQAQNSKTRFGHTEAAVELAKQVAVRPVVVICEILADDGDKASRETVNQFCRQYSIEGVSLQELKNFLT